MDLVLVFLVVLSGRTIERYKHWACGCTYPLKSVELGQHDCLLGTQVPPERLPNIWHQRNDDRQ